MRRLTRMTVAAALAAALGVPAAARGHEQVIEADHACGGLGAKEGGLVTLKINVPEGLDRMVIETWGGQGNLDVFVRHGQAPDPKNHEYRGTGPGNAERIGIARPREGWWYIGLHGRTAFSDASVRVTFQVAGVPEAPPVVVSPPPVAPPPVVVNPRDPIPVLSNGDRVRGLAGGIGEAFTFRLHVPRGSTSVRFALEGGQGEYDLYIHHGSPPTRERFSDMVSRGGDLAVSEILEPAEGFWFLCIQGRSAFRDVTLAVNYEPVQPVVVAPPGPVEPPAPPDRGHGPWISVVDPAAGTTWQAGAAVEIRWTASPDVRRLRILFSDDGGRTWLTEGLPPDVEASTGRYVWRVPPDRWPQGRLADGRVRLIDHDNQATWADSAIFRVVFPARGAASPPPGHEPDAVQPGGQGPDGYEPDDQRERARPVPLAQEQEHTIFPKKDQDWLLLQGVRPGRYVLEVFQVAKTLTGEIWAVHADGKEKRVQTFNAKAGETTTINLVVSGQAVAFKIKLAARSDHDTGPYKVRVVPAPPTR